MIETLINEPIRNLGQPRLLAPVCEAMRTADGVPSEELLAGVDGLICESAVSSILSWELPDCLYLGSDREDRWRTVSSLQKAIRRGDIGAAIFAAHAAHGMDARYLWRRLAVCALEDVGIANLYAVAATYALIGDKRSRVLVGDRKAAVWIAASLALGWKDRTACNLCTVVDFDRSLHPKMHEWKALTDEALIAKADERDSPLRDRMLAAWLLAGTRRFWNVNVPHDNDRERWSLMRLMADSKMPLILYWLADRAAVRGADCLFVGLLPIWQILQRHGDRELQLRTGDCPPDPGQGALLASAYDMHTREGQRALRAFSHHPPVAQALAPIRTIHLQESALFAAAFIMEGGKLDRRISCSDFDSLHFNAIYKELEYFDLNRVEAQCRLLAAVEENLGTLQNMRTEATERLRNSDISKGFARQTPDHTTLHQAEAYFAQNAAKSQIGRTNLTTFPDLNPSRADRFVW